jgi:hypothetical protein
VQLGAPQSAPPHYLHHHAKPERSEAERYLLFSNLTRKYFAEIVFYFFIYSEQLDVVLFIVCACSGSLCLVLQIAF